MLILGQIKDPNIHILLISPMILFDKALKSFSKRRRRIQIFRIDKKHHNRSLSLLKNLINKVIPDNLAYLAARVILYFFTLVLRVYLLHADFFDEGEQLIGCHFCGLVDVFSELEA